VKKLCSIFLLAAFTVVMPGCAASSSNAAQGKTETMQSDQNTSEPYQADTKISEVICDPAFGEYGRLIFPANTGYYSGNTLGELSLTWYGNTNPDKTVEITNYMKNHAEAGEAIFYNIYTEEEKVADPAKEDTDCFSSREIPEKNLLCVMPAAVLRMSVRCTTASPTPWSYRKWVITHLH